MYENRKQDIINVNQPWGMSAKMAANKIQTHAPPTRKYSGI